MVRNCKPSKVTSHFFQMADFVVPQNCSTSSPWKTFLFIDTVFKAIRATETTYFPDEGST